MQIHLNLHSLNSLISFPPDTTGKSRKKNDWGLKYFVYKIGGKWAVSWWSGFCFFSSWISRWELPNYTSYILLSPIFHSESCLFQLSSLSLARLSGRLISFSAKENQKVARHYKTFKIISKKIKKTTDFMCIYLYCFVLVVDTVDDFHICHGRDQSGEFPIPAADIFILRDVLFL